MPEFETALFSLKLNEISQPVKTQYGYHVIQVTAITPAKQSTLDEAKAKVTTAVLNQKKSTAWLAWIAKMKKKVGVVFKEGMATTTTTAGASTTTTSAGATVTTASGPETTAPVTTTTATSTATTAAGAATTAAP